jgi:hypothetical protein
MNIQDVLNLVTKMNRKDIDRVLEVAKLRRDFIVKSAITVGSTVSFVGRHRMLHRGIVIKINPTRVKVKVGYTTWNVSPSLLTVEDGQTLDLKAVAAE